MATINTNPKTGSKRILFYDRNKKRRAICIGKASESTAEAIKTKVERFLNAQLLGEEPTRADIEWLGKSKFLDKFRKAGLITAPDIQAAKLVPTLDQFLADYSDRRRNSVKPATLLVWSQVTENLVQHMPKGILITEVTPGHAREFHEKLKLQYKKTTVSKRISITKQFFNDAVNWEIIAKSPFDKVSAPKSKEQSNTFVPRDVIARILQKSDTRWQVIFGLARFGGLRTPSETLSLKWSHIDWEKSMMHVPEPKVEHHDGRGVRNCPLFPELREILEIAFEVYGSTSQYVVDADVYRTRAMRKTGWANANLRTQALKILEKAGVDPWPRLFHSLRASRQTELESTFPTHVVCEWLGNSVQVARESYLMVTDDHIAAAINKPEQSEKFVLKQCHEVPKSVLKSTPHRKRTEHARSGFTNEKTGKTSDFPRLLLLQPMEDRGLEKTSNSLEFLGVDTGFVLKVYCNSIEFVENLIFVLAELSDRDADVVATVANSLASKQPSHTLDSS